MTSHGIMTRDRPAHVPFHGTPPPSGEGALALHYITLHDITLHTPEGALRDAARGGARARECVRAAARRGSRLVRVVVAPLEGVRVLRHGVSCVMSRLVMSLLWKVRALTRHGVSRVVSTTRTIHKRSRKEATNRTTGTHQERNERERRRRRCRGSVPFLSGFVVGAGLGVPFGSPPPHSSLSHHHHHNRGPCISFRHHHTRRSPTTDTTIAETPPTQRRTTPHSSFFPTQSAATSSPHDAPPRTRLSDGPTASLAALVLAAAAAPRARAVGDRATQTIKQTNKQTNKTKKALPDVVARGLRCAADEALGASSRDVSRRRV